MSRRIIVMPKIAMKKIADNQVEGSPVLAIISIDANEYEHLRFKTSFEKSVGGLLKLTFDDVIYSHQDKAFTDDMAIQLIDFVNSKKDKVDNWFVQCTAGISRSGSVSLWLCHYLGYSQEQFWKDNPNILPNPLVLKLLEKHAPTGRLPKEEETIFARLETMYPTKKED